MRMREHTTSKLYDLWARVYDYTFGTLVRTRQRRALELLRARPGQRVLDLGVGTGAMLEQYPRGVTVVGMDLSAGMLAKAAGKCRTLGLDQCHLVRADAMLPPFAPQSFDHIMICHTISVVSDPARLMAWATQLVKPGGRIIVLNHFRSSQPVIAWFEKVLNPLFVKIGWRSDLALEECLRRAAVNVDYVYKLRAWDMWRIVVLSRPPFGHAIRAEWQSGQAPRQTSVAAADAYVPPSVSTGKLALSGR